MNSGTARVGDRFSANVTEPVYAGGGVEVIPVGSRMGTGNCGEPRSEADARQHHRRLRFGSAAERQTTVINGSLTTLQADNVNADNEGTVKGTSNRKRDAVFIGGGAATAQLSVRLRAVEKARQFGILGGALGTGARVFEKEKEAEVKSGTEFGVILNRSVSLPASTVRQS